MFNNNEVVPNRYDILFLISYSYSQTQGDPDNQNAPRMDPYTGIGLVTDAGFKRGLRTVFSTVAGLPILLECNGVIETSIRKVAADAGINLTEEAPKETSEEVAPKGKGKGKAKKVSRDSVAKTIEAACDRFIDLRAFGGVITKPFSEPVTGPVQVVMGTSVDPIEPLPLTITRRTAANADRAESQGGKTQELGSRPAIPFGLYRQSMAVNPFQAEATGFTEKDLGLLIVSAFKMYEITASSLRSNAVVEKAFVFKHTSKHGSYPRHKLLDLVKVKSNIPTPRSYSDYDVHVEQLPAGVEMTVLDGTEDWILRYFD